MKKLLKNSIHGFFKIRVLEKLLRSLVAGRYVTSFWAKIVPPNPTYPNPTYRVVRSGFLYLNANLHDYNDWKAYWDLKEIERENLYKMAEDCKVVVDVGVNNGWVIMNLGTIVSKNGGNVVGFEPHPVTFSRCIQNLKQSEVKNVEVFNMGCGAEEAELFMTTVRESNSGMNRIILNEKEQSNRNLQKVKVVTLDQQLKGIEKIDLIKIDVEGFEYQVLKGAENILKLSRPKLFIEIDDELLKKNGSSAEGVYNLLKGKYNYGIKNATNGKVVDPASLKGCHIDIICLPGLT